MKAAVYYDKKDLRVQQVSPPSSPAKKQVLIKSLFCGICGSDLHEYAHGPMLTTRTPHPLTGASLPQILGHEFSAQVVEVGSDVRNVKIGDFVSIMPVALPQDDYYIRRGQHLMSGGAACIGTQYPWGGMGEYALVDDYNVFKLPEGMDPRLGALIEPASIAISGVEKAGVSGGSSVLVTGGGPIGALVVLAAAAYGASKIFVSEPNAIRRQQIENLGVGAIALDPLNQDVVAIIQAATEDGVGADAVIECSGVAAGLNTAISAVKKAGKVVQIALFTKDVTLNPNLWASKGLTISGVWGPPDISCWPRILDMVASGKFPIGRIVTSEVTLDDVVGAGLEKLLDPNNQEMKILVKIGE